MYFNIPKFLNFSIYVPIRAWKFNIVWHNKYSYCNLHPIPPFGQLIQGGGVIRAALEKARLVAGTLKI